MKEILQSNSKKSFAIKLLFFALTVFAADRLIGFLLKQSYFKQKSGYNYLTTHSIEKATDPVLIFGSSRAVNIINPLILEEKLKLPGYNAGRDGQSIFYHYAVLKSVLDRYKPQMVILSFDAGDFAKGRQDYDRLSSLLPYWETEPEIEPIMELKGPFEKIKTASKIYPYNSMILPILSANLKKTDRYDNMKGYMPLRRKIKGPLLTIDYTKTAMLDQNKVNTYKNFIKTCVNAGIKLHVVCPPYLINAIGTDASIETAKNIAKEYGVSFLDHSRDLNYSQQPDLFADFRHLNEEGSRLFTEQITSSITAFE